MKFKVKFQEHWVFKGFVQPEVGRLELLIFSLRTRRSAHIALNFFNLPSSFLMCSLPREGNASSIIDLATLPKHTGHAGWDNYMNMFQTANGAATFLILTQLVTGFSRYFVNEKGEVKHAFTDDWGILLLSAFIVAFRVKTFLDDHKHFAEEEQDKSAFRFAGFGLAVCSWFLWGFAAGVISNPVFAGTCLFWSIVVSTSWIGVHLMEILFKRTVFTSGPASAPSTWLTRWGWSLFNLGYLLCLAIYIGYLPFHNHTGDVRFLVPLFLLLAFDIWATKSFKDLKVFSQKEEISKLQQAVGELKNEISILGRQTTAAHAAQLNPSAPAPKTGT